MVLFIILLSLSPINLLVRCGARELKYLLSLGNSSLRANLYCCSSITPLSYIFFRRLSFFSKSFFLFFSMDMSPGELGRTARVAPSAQVRFFAPLPKNSCEAVSYPTIFPPYGALFRYSCSISSLERLFSNL